MYLLVALVKQYNLYFEEMHDFTKKLYEELKTASDYTRKAGAEAYMKNQFRFIGMDTVSRRDIFKKLFLKNGFLLHL